MNRIGARMGRTGAHMNSANEDTHTQDLHNLKINKKPEGRREAMHEVSPPVEELLTFVLLQGERVSD